MDLVVALTANAQPVPSCYEHQLRDWCEHGELMADQVDQLLTVSVYQVLYHSPSAARPMGAMLHTLREQARYHNAQIGITGQLLYSNGRSMQLLEGPQSAVEQVCARIQADERPTRMATVGAGPAERACRPQFDERSRFWTGVQSLERLVVGR